MSTVTRVNFTPVRDALPVHRANFPLADPTIADPLNAVALVDGEWLSLDANYELVRAADVGTEGAAAVALSYPHWNERGRSDMLATGERRTVVLWGGFWEYDTRIFDVAANINGSGNTAIAAVGDPLTVATVVIGTRNYVGLVGHDGGPQVGGTDVTQIVGYVTRLPANNGGQLRMRGGMLF
jgi:hypothetical protein